MFAPVGQSLPEERRCLLQHLVKAHGFGRFAAVAALAVLVSATQQFVKFFCDYFPVRIKLVQQLRRILKAHGAGDPVQVMVLCGQHMGLLVIQVLDAVLYPAQEVIGLCQRLCCALLHEARLGEAWQGAQCGTGPEFRKLATAHNLEQLHNKFDLPDAAPRELDVVGPLRVSCTALARMVPNLPVQNAQGIEDVVVQIAPEHKRHDHAAQRQRRAICHAVQRRDNAALEPGKSLPFAPLDMQVLLQCVK